MILKRLTGKAFASLAMLAMFTAAFAQGPDLEREQRLADQIVDDIFDGEPVMLKAGEHEFLSIYTEAGEDAKGAAIIMHGRGFHPDWPDAINPLRVGLTENGWNTLSLQMPVLEKEAKYNDYVFVFPDAYPRIEAAIKYAREQGNDKVVLIAHSCSVHMVMSWINKKGAQGADAVVGIGMGATDYKQPMLEDFPFSRITVPVLDIYGEDDYPAVHRLAPDRLAAIQAAGNAKSAQLVVPGADHYFKGKGETLVDAVSSWLDTL